MTILFGTYIFVRAERVAQTKKTNGKHYLLQHKRIPKVLLSHFCKWRMYKHKIDCLVNKMHKPSLANAKMRSVQMFSLYFQWRKRLTLTVYFQQISFSVKYAIISVNLQRLKYKYAIISVNLQRLKMVLNRL